jgi:dolichol-phosphate mannosyltransferase
MNETPTPPPVPRPGHPLVSIILPTFNEAEMIQPMICDLVRHIADPLEIIIVDDSSPDGTADIVERMNDPHVTVIRRSRDRGLASAIMRGVIESRGAIIGWMDADAFMMPPLLPGMIDKLADHDLVFASRYVPGGGDNRHGMRIGASRLLNAFARLVLGPHFHDYSSNFVVVRRSVFDAVVPIPTGYGEFFIELLFRAQRKGLKLLEVPYTLSERTMGISKSAPNWGEFLRLGFRYGVRIILTRLRGVDYD